MPDNGNQGLPTPPSDEQIKGFGASMVSSVKELWGKYSIFFIIVGALLLIAKFGDLIISFLTWLSKRQVENAQKQDAALKQQEDAANKQANDLIKKADELPSQQGPVDENWNKKK